MVYCILINLPYQYPSGKRKWYGICMLLYEGFNTANRATREGCIGLAPTTPWSAPSSDSCGNEVTEDLECSSCLCLTIEADIQAGWTPHCWALLTHERDQDESAVVDDQYTLSSTLDFLIICHLTMNKMRDSNCRTLTFLLRKLQRFYAYSSMISTSICRSRLGLWGLHSKGRILSRD